MHIADIHLGYRQYNLFERFKDFERAFRKIINIAIEKKVDFIICAGDLFDRDSIDPVTFGQCYRILVKLKNAGIPIFSIEGNHDRKLSSRKISWLNQLARMGLMILLRAEYKDTLQIFPYDSQKGRGGYFKFNEDLAIFGIQYFGASLLKYLEEFIAQLAAGNIPRSKVNLLMLHTGVKHRMPYKSGSTEITELLPLKQYFNYVALGHFHDYFIEEGWLFNPGSLEPCGFDEVGTKKTGGYFLNTINAEGAITTEFFPLRLRPFFKLHHKISPGKTAQETQAEIINFIDKRSAEIRPKQQDNKFKAPVIELQITGSVEFDPVELDLSYIEKHLKDQCHALHVKPKFDLESEKYAVRIDDMEQTREEIEKRVFESLIQNNIHYRERSNELTELIIELKSDILQREEPEEITRKIHSWREKYANS